MEGESMRLLKFAHVYVLLFTACSHVQSPDRAPSSIHTMGLKATFDEISQSTDPRAEARAYVDRLLVLDLRAHGWRLEVDEAFAHAQGPVNLFSQPSYLKLLVAHPFSERMEDKIVEFYHDAHVASIEPVSNSEERARADRAMLVVAGIHDSLLHAHHNVGERVLLNHLMRALHEDRHANTVSDNPHPLTAPLEGEELIVAASDSGEQLKQMVADLPETDEVKEEVETRAAELSNEIIEDPGREPQSANIMPTVGANGTIDGFSFPRGTWALTFDDGPHPTISEKDLANLQSTKTPGTFFWLAQNVKAHADIVKTMIASGYPVGDHSWSHPQLNKPADLKRLKTNLDREINQSFILETAAYGHKPKFFRCPYGAGYRDPVIRGMIAKNGMIHVSWNVDSLDWQDPVPASVQKRVEQQMAANGRGIILFHDIHTPALTVVPNLIAKNKGKIRWVDIPHIVDELNGKR
jgi:peptidoglycan/xylan/chitin deacetylase (PgdA/CDA1 family)